ncbi:DUF2752 domain-containing protein [Solicola sp. PLA-1-18]|uniref:DUF2752 domain-containing protein n=1 Tax=Solicola sp. PLA-1-18 TaxID=3380532 RepID=UPI003B7D16C6
MRAPLLTAAAGASAVVALRLRDPHSHGSWGLCPFQALTGLPCPGCGGLRAVNDLTHLDLVGALSSNALAVLLGAVLVVGGLRWVIRRWRGGMQPMFAPSVPATVAIGVLVLAFGVVRVTPWGSVLAP